jgi:hypothetical protein
MEVDHRGPKKDSTTKHLPLDLLHKSFSLGAGFLKIDFFSLTLARILLQSQEIAITCRRKIVKLLA